MSTIRYTAGGDYDPTNSVDITPNNGTVNDLRNVNGGFVALDGTDPYDLIARSDEDGIFADVSGNTLHCVLEGGVKGDVLIGGLNDDTLDGGDGDDLLEGGAGGDAFDGGSGYNTVSYAHAADAVVVSLFLAPSQGDAQGDTFANVQAFIGSAHDDTFYFYDGYKVEGGAGADTIYDVRGGFSKASYEHSAEGVHVDLSGVTANSGGDAEGDVLHGITRVIGSTHADTLIAAATDSRLNGNGGLDTITGGAGDDTISVTGQWAAVDGGDGFDRLRVGGDGGMSNPITPDAGALVGVERVIVVSGTFLDLSLQSAIDGTIKLNSRAGEFTAVVGTEFDDRIVGGDGSDFIVSAGGRDHLTGGAGSDVFAFVGGGPRDVILDFSGHNGDGDQIFFASATNPTLVEKFSGTGSAEILTETVAPGVQLVLFDSDGNGRADSSLRVMSADALTADDFYNPSLKLAAHADGFASHPEVVEALHTMNIAGLV